VVAGGAQAGGRAGGARGPGGLAPRGHEPCRAAAAALSPRPADQHRPGPDPGHHHRRDGVPVPVPGRGPGPGAHVDLAPRGAHAAPRRGGGPGAGAAEPGPGGQQRGASPAQALHAPWPSLLRRAQPLRVRRPGLGFLEALRVRDRARGDGGRHRLRGALGPGGGHGLDGRPRRRPRDRRGPRLRPADGVHHTAYFRRPETLDFAAGALEIP
jgi:hypothetical protein